VSKADREVLDQAARLAEARERQFHADMVEAGELRARQRRESLEGELAEATLALDVFTQTAALVAKLTPGALERCGSRSLLSFGMTVPASRFLPSMLKAATAAAAARVARLKADRDALPKD
jgi:hypothetical protein